MERAARQNMCSQIKSIYPFTGGAHLRKEEDDLCSAVSLSCYGEGYHTS